MHVPASLDFMMNLMISAEFLSFEVLQSWSSKAPAVGPELWRTRLIEDAAT